MFPDHLFTFLSFGVRYFVWKLTCISQAAEMQKLRESVQAKLVFRQDPRQDKWEERRRGARRDGWGVFSRADGE